MTGKMPEIEWKIDLGHIVTIVALIIAGATAWGAMSTKLDQYSAAQVKMEAKMDSMQRMLDLVREQQIVTKTELEYRQQEENRHWKENESK